jgi:hypothetical protein
MLQLPWQLPEATPLNHIRVSLPMIGEFHTIIIIIIIIFFFFFIISSSFL